MAATAMNVRRAFEAQGMSLKDEASGKVATHVSKVLGIADFEELAEEYEVFHINRGETKNVVTAELLEAFRDHLQSERAKAIRNSSGSGGAKSKTKGNAWHTYTKYDLDDVKISLADSFGRVEAKKKNIPNGNGNENETDLKAFSKPQRKRPADLEELKPNKKSAFAQRPRSGTEFTSMVVSQRQKEEAPAAKQEETKVYKKVVDEKLGVAKLLRGPATDARFMFDTPESRDKLVDERKNRLVKILEDKYGIIASNSVYNISNEPVVVVGRVCNESIEGRINEASILLEGSSTHSNSMRVRIDTSKLDSLSLFPGQVIAVEGLNPSGHCITALSVLTGIPKPVSSTREGGDDKKRKIAIASGPFTTVSDLSFEPLKALVEAAGKSNPDLLVLCGPFVDKDHPIISKGTIDIEFDELFRICCESFEKLPKETKVVLVPSVRDIHHHPVYPQPPFRTSVMAAESKDKVMCLSNPTMLSCKGVTIAATSHDILKHLSGTEVYRSSSSSDRMSRLALHVLQQRMFYPLYPPAPGSCLDSTLALERDSIFLPATPDVLILPSDLNPFAKEVPASPTIYSRKGYESIFSAKISVGKAANLGSCVCINPGRLAKAATGGTYSTIDINNGKLEKVSITRI